MRQNLALLVSPLEVLPSTGSRMNAILGPQPLGPLGPPLALANITHVSEDCLNLNIARPSIESHHEKLPVMLWIHGGSFWTGVNTEPTTAPAGLIKQSILNGSPVMHVAINYRLGFFGFAQSDTLKTEGSENAGLRDQRLAIEWVRDNISNFGGDPEKITILGQSSGGLAIGMQILAYGGKKPLPFWQGIGQSQSLEPGITGNFTIDAMTAVAKNVTCDATNIHAPETIACLRSKSTEELRLAAIATYSSDIGHNIGDIWLPVVDGDFLPAAPSQLIAEGRIGKANFISGWTQDDLDFYTDTSITTAQDTYNFIRAYLPGLTEKSLQQLLGLYPSTEYKPGVNLSIEFYRSSRIFRDVLMVCPSLYLGAGVAKTHGVPVYHYDFNQTIVGPIVDKLANVSGMGVGHTSEFAYVFDSVDAYRKAGYQVDFTQADRALVERASRSWSNSISRGFPSLNDSEHNTLKGWNPAYNGTGGPYVMTIGGPHERLSALAGPGSIHEVEVQRLKERCDFLNSPEIIAALQY